MKRTAAVLGPTPPFIRWAIKKECALRDLEVENLADQTFRQLRNLRELSNGYRENRVFDGICVHPAPIGAATQLRAFPIKEVFDFFGDQQSLSSRCGNCTANSCAHRDDNLETDWAGCFGLLPVNLNFTFGHTRQCQALPTDDLVALVDNALEKENDFHRLWTQKWVPPNAVSELATIFEAVSAQRKNHPHLQQFTDACRRCADFNLPLFAELIPSGFSDGVHWKLNRACEVCRFESTTPRTKGMACPVCKTRHADDFGRKAKVLGLRPYLRLARVIGEPQTHQFIERYRAHLKQHRPN